MWPFFGVFCMIMFLGQDLSWSQPTGEMLEFIKKDKTTDEEDGAFLLAVTQWAEKDLSAAQKWAYGLKGDNAKDEKVYSYATMGVMDAVAKKGVKPSFEWVKTLSTSEERFDAVSSISCGFKNTPSLEIAEAGIILESGSPEQLGVASSFVSASANEVPGLIKFAQKIDGKEYGNAIIDSCFYVLNKQDPEEAIKLWEALPNDQKKDQLFGRYFAQSVENRPTIEALEWLKVHTFDGFNKERTRDNIIQKWTDSDPDAAGEYVLKEFGKNPKASQILNYTETLSKQWPEKVLPWLRKLPNSEKETFYADRYAEKLREQNPKLFDKTKKETEDPIIIKALNHASFSGASTKGPQEACKMYMALDQKAKKDLEVEFLFSCLKWHEATPVEFMRWARTLRKEQFDSINLFLQVTSKKIDSDERKAYIADEMALGPKRDSAIFAIAQKKVGDDPKGAALWAQQLPLDNARVEAIDAVAWSWSLKNPSDACDWLIFISNTLPDNSQCLFIPFVNLSNTDPLLALQKAMKLKTGEARNTIITLIAFGLAEKDPGQLQVQIKSTKDPEDRNFLLSILLRTSLENPESCRKVADWLLEIEPCPFQRKETNYFFYLLKTWGNADRKSCLEWVRSAPTTDSDQAVFKAVVIANLLAGDDPFLSGKIPAPNNGTGSSFNEFQNKNSASGSKNAFPQKKLKVARKDSNQWSPRILHKPVRGDRALLIIRIFFGAIAVLGIIKAWTLLRSKLIPWPIRISLSYVHLVFYCSFIFAIIQITEKYSILSEATAVEVAATCFAMCLMAGYYFVCTNQCAAGSRAFLVFGILFTCIGIAGTGGAILHNSNPAQPIGVLLSGLFPLLGSLPKSSREFRKNSRVSKQSIPRHLIYSALPLLAICVYGVGGDIIKNIGSNSKLSLYMLFMFLPAITIWLGPIYWGLRWRDGFALRFYQILLLAVCLFSFFLIFGFFTSGLNIKVLIEYLFLSLSFCVSLALTFHSSVRKWAQGLRPAL